MKGKESCTVAALETLAVVLLMPPCSRALDVSDGIERLPVMVQGKAWPEIRALADQVEEDWLTTPDERYFRRMGSICKALAPVGDVKAIDYLYLQDFVGRLFTKRFTGGGQAGESAAWLEKAAVARILVSEPASFASLPTHVYATLRYRSSLLLAMFCHQVRSAYKTGYEPKPVYLNVVPPLNPDHELLEAGMDPRGIRNAEARKAYEEAVRVNGQNAEENSVQIMLKRYLRAQIPLILTVLKTWYARAPQDPEELTTFLAMALLGDKDEQPKRGQ